MSRAEHAHIIELAGNVYESDIRMAEAAEKRGDIAESTRTRLEAELRYHVARARHPLRGAARLRADNRHADASGAPLFEGGQGRTSRQVERQDVACIFIMVGSAALMLCGLAILIFG